MNLAKHWHNTSKTKKQLELIRYARSLGKEKQPDYTELVRAPFHWGVYASTGRHFRYAIFGRDSIETAEDLLDSHHALAHDAIMTLASLQGVKEDLQSEEEPGKIHHEFRQTTFDTIPVPPQSLEIMHRLQSLW